MLLNILLDYYLKKISLSHAIKFHLKLIWFFEKYLWSEITTSFHKITCTNIIMPKRKSLLVFLLHQTFVFFSRTLFYFYFFLSSFFFFSSALLHKRRHNFLGDLKRSLYLYWCWLVSLLQSHHTLICLNIHTPCRDVNWIVWYHLMFYLLSLIGSWSKISQSQMKPIVSNVDCRPMDLTLSILFNCIC